MMKKTIKFVILPMMFLLLLAPMTYAVSRGFEDDLPPPGTGTEQTGGVSINAEQVPSIIRKVATYLYNAVLILSVIFILISAFYFLKGGDNPVYVKKAKSQLVYAVIGIAIAILAFSVEKIIASFIQVGQGG